jgi:WD40 repeat protein
LVTARPLEGATEGLIGLDLDPLNGHSGAVTCMLHCGPEGRPLLLTGSADRQLRVWDATTSRCRRVFKGHTEGVTCAAEVGGSEGGGRWLAASGSLDTTVRLWDFQAERGHGPLVHTLRGHGQRVACVAAVGSGMLLSGSDDARVKLWDVETGGSVLNPLHAPTP